MIVRMAKIVLMGPQDLLLDTLTLVQELGILHVDEEQLGASPEEGGALTPQLPAGDAVLQHQYYEKLRRQIDELLAELPEAKGPLPTAAPRISVDALAELAPRHLEAARRRREQLASLAARLEEFSRYRLFLGVLTRIAAGRAMAEQVEYAGFDLPPEADLATVRTRLEEAAGGRVALEMVPAGDNQQIGVVLVPVELAGRVRTVLEEFRLSWFQAPPGLEQLTVPQRLAAVDSRLAGIRRAHAALLAEEKAFAKQWQAEYQKARAWLSRRLSLVKVTAAVVRTRMCFFIHGWLPASDLPQLRDKLAERFGGRVLVEEAELAEHDFARIPTALRNPAYFEPFELFTRLLPIPHYSSFDLTPFIGIFFPIFFGMMLGDVGYGLILMGVALVLVFRFRLRKNISDAGKILFVSALYAVVFGCLYGELFGTLGHEFFGLTPVWFDRQTALIPMLSFAIGAGVVHVLLGLVLGVISSLRLKMRKEALLRLVHILLILCLCGTAASWFVPGLRATRGPLLLTLAVFTPVLILAGGLLAPLELLKSVGNIISYARIMAVGLTSVLLALVANYMAGRLGSIWAGIVVAFLLHLFNLALGVFAPTIHSLRLHYVEFLTKFMEPGGRKFTPLGGRGEQA